MKRFALTIFIVFSFLANSQVNYTKESDANKIVKALVGDGVEFLNASFTGSPEGIGLMGKGNVKFPLDSGVVLGSGPLDELHSGFVNDFFNLSGDADLEKVLGNTTTTFDATILEFDFIPSTSLLQFNFVFTSKEYPNFVCSSFNDVFGFFISGNGINGGFSNNSENYALIPGTNTPISINTINNGNPDDPTCVASNSNLFVDNLTNFPFGGVTKSLQVKTELTPCDTFHIKIAIADGSDASLSSFVVLEEGSFKAVPVIMKSLSGSSKIEEGKKDTISLELEHPVLNDTIIEVELGGTALEGGDFTVNTTQVKILAGDSIGFIYLDAVLDKNIEGVESVIFSIKFQTCKGEVVISETIFITDSEFDPGNIPNLFSPNGDGVNDYFVIDNLEDYPNSQIDIYNRYGRKVFSSENYLNNWNGTIHNKGLRVSDGVYFYKFVPAGLNDITVNGFVEVVR